MSKSMYTARPGEKVVAGCDGCFFKGGTFQRGDIAYIDAFDSLDGDLWVTLKAPDGNALGTTLAANWIPVT